MDFFLFLMENLFVDPRKSEGRFLMNLTILIDRKVYRVDRKLLLCESTYLIIVVLSMYLPHGHGQAKPLQNFIAFFSFLWTRVV